MTCRPTRERTGSEIYRVKAYLDREMLWWDSSMLQLASDDVVGPDADYGIPELVLLRAIRIAILMSRELFFLHLKLETIPTWLDLLHLSRFRFYWFSLALVWPTKNAESILWSRLSEHLS
jgi:hypothetical protein